MALLAVTPVSKSGLADITASLTAADVAGDTVNASSGLLIVVKNDDASTHTLTLTRPSATVPCGNFGDADLSDITLAVSDGDVGFVTIPEGYGANGLFTWTYEAVTSVSVGVFSLAP